MDENQLIIRVEVVVECPLNLDVNSLTIVDPKNPSERGFPFVEIVNWNNSIST